MSGNDRRIDSIIDKMVEDNVEFNNKPIKQREADKFEMYTNISIAIAELTDKGKQLVLDELDFQVTQKSVEIFDRNGINIDELKKITTSIVASKISEARRNGIILLQRNAVQTSKDDTALVVALALMINNYEKLSDNEKRSILKHYSELSDEQRAKIDEIQNKEVEQVLERVEDILKDSNISEEKKEEVKTSADKLKKSKNKKDTLNKIGDILSKYKKGQELSDKEKEDLFEYIDKRKQGEPEKCVQLEELKKSVEMGLGYEKVGATIQSVITKEINTLIKEAGKKSEEIFDITSELTKSIEEMINRKNKRYNGSKDSNPDDFYKKKKKDKDKTTEEYTENVGDFLDFGFAQDDKPSQEDSSFPKIEDSDVERLFKEMATDLHIENGKQSNSKEAKVSQEQLENESKKAEIPEKEQEGNISEVFQGIDLANLLNSLSNMPELTESVVIDAGKETGEVTKQVKVVDGKIVENTTDKTQEQNQDGKEEV